MTCIATSHATGDYQFWDLDYEQGRHTEGSQERDEHMLSRSAREPVQVLEAALDQVPSAVVVA